MSDYVTALRQDLVEAAERQQRRSPAGACARPLHPRVVVAAGRARRRGRGRRARARRRDRCARSAPRRARRTPRSSRRSTSAGSRAMRCAVGGALVIADYDGTLWRVLAGRPAQLARSSTSRGSPVSLAADGDAVWVVTEDPPTRRPSAHSGGPPRAAADQARRAQRAAARSIACRVDGVGDAIAAGAVGVWLPAYARARDRDSSHRPARPPPAPSDARRARRGRAVRVDAPRRPRWSRSTRRGRVVRRVRGISRPLEFTERANAAPRRDGAWAGRAGRRACSPHRGRPGDAGGSRSAAPRACSRASGATLWVSAIASAGHYELVRVDADEGKVTGRVGARPLRRRRSIVPVGKQLWVITSGGDALLINPE